MQISSDKILNKMANEIAKAKSSEGQKSKEHVLVVRALCDLLLDEQVESSTYREPQVQSQIIDHNQSRCNQLHRFLMSQYI